MILLERITSLVLLRTLDPGIQTLNHIESKPVQVFVTNIWSDALHVICIV